MIKVLIIGLGSIGIRHLQSILTIEEKLKIDCLDSSQAALNRVKKSFDCQNIRLIKKIENIDYKYDFLIHSTNSNIRFKSLCEILSLSKIKFGILEKVLVQSLEDLILLKKKSNQFEKCWVNTPMDELDLYKKLKKRVNILDVSKIQFNYFQGLASNAIHFINFISSWKKMLPDKIDTSKLTDWHKTKRKGFFDVSGELKINYADNTCLILKSFKNKLNYHCLINENKKVWKLIEKEKLFYTNDGIEVEGNVEYQSELSGKIIKKILLFKKCDLPELSWSIDCHKLLIKSLLYHWNSYYNTKTKVLPIT